MGKKYGSIHVYGGEQDKILLLIKSFYNNDDSINETMQQAADIFQNPIVKSMFKRFSQLSKPEILIIQTKSYISIYDENITFEDIEDTVKRLSYIIDRPIVYTSNFDGDVFIFGVYQKGTVVTYGKIGKGLSWYDIVPEKIDIDKFCKVLEISNEIPMKCLNTTDIISDIEQEIEKELRITLKITFKDIQNEPNYKKKLVDDRIHIYQKLR